ncbi:LTA synthase family protein [Sphingobacterium sp. MYb382]|uniref:LTA synthase family protein n=1 Tax=Sphingobacterium sp. MYb382 TaxID=2745278 RepID=UPI00309CE789
MKSIQFQGFYNKFLVIALRFIGLLFLYALLRVGFFLYNQSLFPMVGAKELLGMSWGGLRFDIVALLYLNILYIVLLSLPFPFTYNRIYQQVAKWIFIVTNSIGIALNLMDYAYYPFTLKRTTGTVFGQFSNESNLGKLFVDFLVDYWYLLLVFALFVFVLVKLYDVLQLQKPKPFGWLGYVGQTGLFLVVAFLFIGGVRGGWAHSTRPITLSNAGDYVKNAEEMNIVLNTPFSMLKTLKAVQLKEVHYYSDAELDKIYPVIHQPQATGNFKKMNVVFLIMESFAKEYIGAYNHDLDGCKYKGYTPFLDSLIGQSYTFEHSFANGRKSIDALPSVMTGIPSVGEPFVLSIYSGNKTTSIARLLGNEGYETAFFHGAPNGSMGFSAYMQLAGVKHYYGKNEYNNDADFDGIWGIWDEPFMQFMANKLDAMPQPFFAGFFSLSSHHPFKVPAKYAGVFPKGPLPVHEPMGYSDHALKEFFATASKMPWFDNTLFVLCADHSTTSYFPEYSTTAQGFAIPILFYAPGKNLKGMSDKLVQQIDIMPTVLNYLGYDKPYFSFGFDAFAPQKNNFLVNNIGGTFNFFEGDYFMTHDGKKPVSLFNLKTDRLQQHNLLETQKDTLQLLDDKLKAFIQRYNYSMIHNKLIAGE